MAYAIPTPNYNLQNFKQQHLKRKKHGDAVLKRQSNNHKAQLLQVKFDQDFEVKYRAWIFEMKSHGAVYVDADTWGCTKCDYKAGFVSRNNIKVHMQSMQQLAHVTKLNIGVELKGGQTIILSNFANTTLAG